jgi:methylamine--corrinoid protein Co-methyltransferase
MRDWDSKIVPSKTAEVLKEYDFKSDPNNPIPSDDSLADEVYEAGYKLAVELGVFCVDTNRIIKISEEELKEALNGAPDKLTLGKGTDQVEVIHRKPEDRQHIMVSGGPFGVVVSEDLWIPVHMSVAQYPVVDRLVPGTLNTVYSKELRSGTTFEFLGGILEAKLTKEALRRVDRPGMPTGGVMTDMTGLGFLGGWSFGGLEETDFPSVSMASELKTSYYLLTNAAYVHERKGCV